jgi:ATP-dependent DNA helicase RecQ
VLKDWSHGDDRWPQRPVGVVAVASRRRPHLVMSLAERIAAVGRLPFLGTVERIHYKDAAGRGNSAQRVRALHDAFAVPALPALAGPLLLVDDYVDSGWTMAIVARLLRQAGAPGVLPLTLATS